MPVLELQATEDDTAPDAMTQTARGLALGKVLHAFVTRTLLTSSDPHGRGNYGHNAGGPPHPSSSALPARPAACGSACLPALGGWHRLHTGWLGPLSPAHCCRCAGELGFEALYRAVEREEALAAFVRGCPLPTQAHIHISAGDLATLYADFFAIGRMLRRHGQWTDRLLLNDAAAAAAAGSSAAARALRHPEGRRHSQLSTLYRYRREVQLVHEDALHEVRCPRSPSAGLGWHTEFSAATRQRHPATAWPPPLLPAAPTTAACS
jgi:hypothetical protein